MRALTWLLAAMALGFLVVLIVWLVTLPGCSDLVGAGYCWGNR